MSEEKPVAANKDAPDNGNTDIVRVKHNVNRLWIGVSDTVIWRVVQSLIFALLLGKTFAPAKAVPDSAASTVVAQQVEALTTAVNAAQGDIKELQKSVQKLDVDTGKLSQALSDLNRASH